MEVAIISTTIENLSTVDWSNHAYTLYTPSPTTDNNINITNTTSYLARDEDIAVIEVTVSATILFLAIAGNSCVIFSLANKRRRQSRMHLMILHLSLADLFVAFFNVLPQLIWDITYRFVGGPFLCVLVKYLQVVAMYASSYVLLATAIDRYYAICHPFASQSWTAKHAHGLVLIAWTASLLFSLPQMFIFSYREVEPGSLVYDCWALFQPEWTLQAYITWMTTSIFIVPTCMLGLFYGQITWVVWKAGRLEEKLLPANLTPLTSRHENLQIPFNSGKLILMQTRTSRTQQNSPITTCLNPSNDFLKNTTSHAGRCYMSNVVYQALGSVSWKTYSNFSGAGQNTTDNSYRKLSGSFQLNMTNSKQKDQNRHNELSNLPSRSFTEGGLIQESWRIRKSLNETNLAKQNQKQAKHLKLKRGFSYPLPPVPVRDSYSVLDGHESKVISVTDSVSKKETLVGVKSPALAGVSTSLRESYEKLGMCNGFHVIKSDSKITFQKPKEHCELCTNQKLCSRCARHVLFRCYSSPDRICDKEAATCGNYDLDDMTINERCSSTTRELNNSANLANICCPVAFDQGQLLPNRVCVHDSDNIRSNLPDIIDVMNWQVGKYNYEHFQGENAVDDVKADYKDYNITTEQDIFKHDNLSEAEDTVSTIGSLISLKLLDAIDTAKLGFSFTSTAALGCDNVLSLSGDQECSHFSTIYAKHKQEQENTDTGVMIEALSTQSFKELSHGKISPGSDVFAETCKSSQGTSDNIHRNTTALPVPVGISRAKLKTIKLTLTVVICYVLCWTPFFVGQMWAAYDANAPYEGPFFSIIMLLASVNSCTNPWIYTVFSNTICQRTRNTCGGPCRCLAACWKLTRPYWPYAREPLATGSPMPRVNCSSKKKRLFDHTSFSTVG